MRKLFAAGVLLLSTQVVSADPYEQREAFWEHVRGLDMIEHSLAYQYLTCTEEAAKDAAHRDPLSPASWMTEWAATEAAKQCEAEGDALTVAAGIRQADAIKAIVYRANVANALAVRRPEPELIHMAPAGKK